LEVNISRDENLKVIRQFSKSWKPSNQISPQVFQKLSLLKRTLFKKVLSIISILGAIPFSIELTHKKSWRNFIGLSFSCRIEQFLSGRMENCF